MDYCFQLILTLLLLFISATVSFCAPPPRRSPRLSRLPWLLYQGAVKENEEPLSLLFQRAVVLQRAGNYDKAMEEYNIILKAAKQVDLKVEQYAEVHVNLGALYLRQKRNVEQAKHHFAMALSHRQMGVAHVNLAVLMLQELTKNNVRDKQQGREILIAAREHCQNAITLKDDDQAQVMATRLLSDIDEMLGKL